MFARQFGPVLICLCLIQPSLVVPLLLTLPVVASEDMIKQNLWAGASMFVGGEVCLAILQIILRIEKNGNK